MSQDEEHARSTEHGGARSPADDPESRKGSRLPPPAFPPGERRRRIRPGPGDSGDELGDAFILPDEPMPPRETLSEEAFKSVDATAQMPGDDEGEVMGMGSDTHMSPEELVAGGDPYVMELVEQVAKLAESLKRKGEAGLHASPEMSRFEATLRAYCVGYLAGRRAENDAD